MKATIKRGRIKKTMLPRACTKGPALQKKGMACIKHCPETPNIIDNFKKCVYSARAKLRPEYSRNIASWTIVSSKCVVGSSTGMRDNSTKLARNKPAPETTQRLL